MSAETESSPEVTETQETASDAQDAAQRWLTHFEQAMASGESSAVTALFADECYWRDLVAMTWNLHTAEGRDAVAAMLDEVGPQVWPTSLSLVGASQADGVTDLTFTFENEVFNGRSIARLRDGRAWTMLTAAEELKDFPEPTGRRRVPGAAHGVGVGRDNWLDKRRKHADSFGVDPDNQPYVLIIGGGQGGIGLARG